MHIVVIGNDAAYAECKTKLGENHQYQQVNKLSSTDAAEVVFDFSDEHGAEKLAIYKESNSPIFLNTVFTTLSAVMGMTKFKSPVFGFCGLPTFFNRSLLEVTVSNPTDKEKLSELAKELPIEFTVVKDQVGMVTPRVIAMIINEAYEARQQGVASREDIDLSMKLGTNYPFGPFEWGGKIGLDNVKKLLGSIEKTFLEQKYHPNF